MRRREFLGGLAGAAIVVPRVAHAQQGRAPRIAVVSNTTPVDQRQLILLGLADNGYDDGKTATITFFDAPTIAEVPRYAADAVASQPDIIVTRASPAPLALKDINRTIPVVFTGIEDPVAIGIVASYARPGGNMTGYMQAGPDIIRKQMQLIRDVLPDLSRLALLGLPSDPPYAVTRPQTEVAAAELKIETTVIDTNEGDPFPPLFAAAVKAGAQAVKIIGATYLMRQPNAAPLATLSIQNNLPLFTRNLAGSEEGMLLAYDAADTVRPSMAYVAAILKGAKPAEMPVVQPTQFEMAVNLRTAKALGITIPQSVLFQATEVLS